MYTTYLERGALPGGCTSTSYMCIVEEKRLQDTIAKKMPFAVVIFTQENSVECVPCSWIDGTDCFWPPRFAKALLKKQSSPDKENWSKFPIRRIGRDYDTLEEAKRVCSRAEETSNVESDDASRKRKAPSRLIESESSDAADNEEEEESPRLITVRKNLPTPPEGHGSGSGQKRKSTGTMEKRVSIASERHDRPVQPPSTPPRQQTQSHVLPIIRRSPRAKEPSRSPATASQSADPSLDNEESQVTRVTGTPLQKILDKLDIIQKDVAFLRQQVMIENAPEEEDETFLPSGDKLNTVEELDDFEDKLDDMKKKRMINWLASLQAGEDGGLICRTIMRKLMTNSLMSNYSGHGQKGKIKFIGKPIYKIIVHAARKASKRRISFNDISHEVLDVLKNAPYKPGGNHYKKKGRHQSDQPSEHMVDLTDSD